MNYEIPKMEIPEYVEISKQLTEEERPKDAQQSKNREIKTNKGESFHKKKEKNKKKIAKQIKAVRIVEKYKQNIKSQKQEDKK